MIRPGNIRVGGVTQESGAANRLMFEDLSHIATKIDNIKGVVASERSRTTDGFIKKLEHNSARGFFNLVSCS